MLVHFVKVELKSGERSDARNIQPVALEKAVPAFIAPHVDKRLLGRESLVLTDVDLLEYLQSFKWTRCSP